MRKTAKIVSDRHADEIIGGVSTDALLAPPGRV